MTRYGIFDSTHSCLPFVVSPLRIPYVVYSFKGSTIGYEIMAFSKVFLEKAFAHSEYSWEENLTEVTDLMDKESAHLFLSKMDETIETLYKERNAISTVSLKEIEVDVDTHPYEVLLYYTTLLRFASLGEVIYEDAEVEGGIYFQIEPLARSKKNPFGMQIRKLKFLQKKAEG